MAKTVTLYSVRITFGDLEMVSVEAEEKPSTYRLRQREGGGFRYNLVVHKDSLLVRGIAFSKSAAIALFISERQKRIESSLAIAKREQKRIRAAEALLAETERRIDA